MSVETGVSRVTTLATLDKIMTPHKYSSLSSGAKPTNLFLDPVDPPPYIAGKMTKDVGASFADQDPNRKLAYTRY